MLLPLIGIVVIVAGFALRLNPLAVVIAAALASGLAAGAGVLAVVDALGHAFNGARYVTAIYIVLPVVGLAEARGLRDRAAALVASLRGATVGRLLAGYLLFRQVTAGLGLISIAGHPQTVRPLLAPMATAAAERQGAPPDDERVAAMAAATDNVGLVFGEDIFLAIGSILLMKGIMANLGFTIEPLRLSLWAIPTAVCAFALHGVRLWRLDRRLARGAGGPAAG